MSAEAERIWSHPKLGELKLGIVDWEGQIELPSFARFDSPLPVGQYDLTLARKDKGEPHPDKGLVDAVVAVVESEAVLADRVLQALWQDLNGTGPETGNWWYGKLDNGEINAFVGDPPTGAKDLIIYFELQRLEARFAPDDSPLVELCCHGDWEEEHGVGVLVEKDEVIGIGYALDVVPFAGLPPATKPIKNPFTGEWIYPQ